MKSKKQLLIWVVFVLTTYSIAANAVRFHAGGESADGPILPGSSDIVLQSFLAQQTGEMETLDPLQGTPGYRRAAWWLTVLSKQLEAKGVQAINLVIVDVQLWSRMKSNTHMGIELDMQIPDNRSNTLMLSEAALSALVNETLSFDQALQLRVVQIHQDNIGIREQLLNG
ncbi:hypothetical protein [Vibrio astriarenae]|uniref:hypothetical protein n=1 Tax=Vibrio astriarenae TaxID=1481923 RepID=UPI003736D067